MSAADGWIGVWRLVSRTGHGRPLDGGHTHLVVSATQLWEVWPTQVYREGDPGPEMTYVTRPRGAAFEIDLTSPSSAIAGLFVLDGDTLKLARSWDDERPLTIEDDRHGEIDTYVRETDDAVRARLAAGVPRVKALVREHATLGRLTWAPNLRAWEGTLPALPNLKVAVPLALSLPADAADARFDEALAQLSRIDLARALRKASDTLLDVYNDGWRMYDDEDGHPHEGPVLDALGFQTQLTLNYVSVGEEGEVSLFFDDGELFWGHSVFVDLDAQLTPIDASFQG